MPSRAPMTLICPAAQREAVNAALYGVWIRQSYRLGRHTMNIPCGRGGSPNVTHYASDWKATEREWRILQSLHIPGLTLDRQPREDALADQNLEIKRAA